LGLDALEIDRARAIRMMILSATIVSTAGLIFRSLNEIDIFEILFFRGAALVLAMLVVVNIFYRQRVFETIRNVGKPGVLGAMFFTGAQTFYVFAFSNTTVANTTFTIALAPFITALLAFIILKEKVSKATCFAMILAGLGIGVIIAGDVSADGKLGILFALLTACCFSCFAVTLRRNKHIEMLPVLLLTGSFSMLIGLFFGKWNMTPSLHDITFCFVWGGLLQGVGQSLLVLSTRVLRAAEIPLIMLLEFTLGPIWVWVLFGEQITFMAAVGGTLIFLAIFGLALNEILKQRLVQS
jgi:DME family drug/metabolite transporter